MTINGVIPFLQVFGSQYNWPQDKIDFSIKTEEVATAKKLTKSR